VQFAVIQSIAPSQGVDVSPINLGDAVVAQIIRPLTFLPQAGRSGNEQVENAAEIALEHRLGMTCDPAKGLLVQVPCFGSNAIGAIKAVSAASLALHGDGTHVIPSTIASRRSARPAKRNTKYKETSLGGIAVNLPGC
jgi:hypothetical protein